MIKIRYLDSVHCKAEGEESINKIWKLLSYKDTVWVQGPFAKKPKIVEKSFIVKRSGLFSSGFLERIKNHYSKNKEKIHIDYEHFEYIKPTEKPNLPGIELRNYQIQLIESAAKKQRGIIQSPTASGKSYIILGLLSMFPKCSCLILCHNIQILNQLKKDIQELGFKDIGFMGGGKKDINKKIVLSTIQTIARMNPNEYYDFDMCLIDECFAGNTKISMKKGTKSIKDIKSGDVVKTKTGFKKVVHTFKNKVKLSDICKVKLSDGKYIYCSKTHLFHTNEGWVEAQHLTKDHILTHSI